MASAVSAMSLAVEGDHPPLVGPVGSPVASFQVDGLFVEYRSRTPRQWRIASDAASENVREFTEESAVQLSPRSVEVQTPVLVLAYRSASDLGHVMDRTLLPMPECPMVQVVPLVLRAPDTAAVGHRTREHGEGHVAEREELVRIHLVGRGQGCRWRLPVRSAIRRAIDHPNACLRTGAWRSAH